VASYSKVLDAPFVADKSLTWFSIDGRRLNGNLKSQPIAI
jgi:hypothetical protein